MPATKPEPGARRLEGIRSFLIGGLRGLSIEVGLIVALIAISLAVAYVAGWIAR
jgi:hypothetical protein